MRWSERETFRFVKIYLSHEFLWNPKHVHYRTKEKRLAGYRSIIAKFRAATGILLSEGELKVKIKNLRSTYTQEVAKIRHRSGPDYAYKPTIRWFTEWHKCFKNSLKKKILDYQFEEPDEEPSDKLWVPDDMDIFNYENEDPFVPQTHSHALKSEPENEKKDEPEDKQSLFRLKRQNDECGSPGTDRSFRTFTGSQDSNSESNVKCDEFDMYGKYIASQLRKMELQKALRLQLEIQNLVSETRISDMPDTH